MTTERVGLVSGPAGRRQASSPQMPMTQMSDQRAGAGSPEYKIRATLSGHRLFGGVSGRFFSARPNTSVMPISAQAADIYATSIWGRPVIHIEGKICLEMK